MEKETTGSSDNLNRQYCTGIVYLTNYYFTGEAIDGLISLKSSKDVDTDAEAGAEAEILGAMHAMAAGGSGDGNGCRWGKRPTQNRSCLRE